MRGDVLLAEITADTVDAVIALATAPAQARFVAPNAVSIAQACFDRTAWFRAIAAGPDLVGFAMLSDPTLPGAEPWPEFDPGTVLLWRFMVDHRHQGRGIGAAAIAALAAHVRTRPGVTRFATTYGEGPGGPAGFYRRAGFVPTGRRLGDESEAVMPLAGGPR